MRMQNNKMNRFQEQPKYGWFIAGIFLLIMQVTSVWAVQPAITEVDFSSLSGDKVQIQLSMDNPVVKPKIFQTDNPARIVLDFVGVKSLLDKKRYAINQGSANAIFIMEAPERTRVVINLSETVPYETKIVDNNIFVILKPVSSTNLSHSAHATSQEKIAKDQFSHLLPEQIIKNIDFRRGAKGEGRLLLELSSPNVVVDVKEQGGKVILNFLNTKLPNNLAKSFDVSDFATPVQKIDARTRGGGVRIVVTPIDGRYDYSSYQSDGLLTINFTPLTLAEKEALLKKKFTYVGKKLTFNFQDIEVRSVLQILADFTGFNIVASDAVDGTVTLRLNDVPWDQALDLILKSKGLAKRQTGNVVLVAPSAEIIKIEEEELAAQEIVELLEPLRTEYIQINFAKAENIQTLLVGSSVVGSADAKASGSKNNIFRRNNSTSNKRTNIASIETKSVLSLRGSSRVDSRTNTLIVKDTAKQLEEIREMIRILDIPVRQVMIEARIVIAEKNFAQEIGVKFGVAKVASIGSNKSFAVGAGPNTFSDLIPAADGSVVNVPDGPNSYLVDLGANIINNHPVGALGMTLARGADYILNLELSALENNNRGEVLANPRVMTSDRELAFIKQGVQIPFTTVTQNGADTRLVDAVLELNVTPQITPNGNVIMDLLIKKDAANIAGGIDKREVSTIVQVRDGETIVLGGVYEGDSGNEVFKIPFFADLPGIGFLFKKTVKNDRKRELLIFVTPKIIKSTLSAR